MEKLRYNKLVFKLTAPIVIIVAVVFAVLIPYMLQVNTSIVEKNMDEQVSHLSLSVRDYINEDVADLREKLKAVLGMLFIEKAINENNIDDLSKLLQSVKKNLGLDFLAVVDNEKKASVFLHERDISFESLSGMKIIKEDLAGEDWASLQILNNKPYAIGALSLNILDKPSIIIAGRPLREPLKMIVEKSLSKYVVVLYNRKGEVIMSASTAHWARMKIPPDILKRITEQKESFYRKVRHDSKTLHIIAYGPLMFNNGFEVIYSVHMPAVDVLSVRNKVILTILAFMFTGILLMILTGYFTSRWVAGRIRKILHGTREISGGKLGYQLKDTSTDEIGELTASFNNMSGSLKESHEWWKHTFNSMSDAVSVHNAEGKVVKVNSSLVRLIGIPKEDILGKHCHEIFHDTGLPMKDCPRVKSMLSRKPEEIEVFESRLGRWLSISASPIFNGNGKANNIIHVVRDITERKRTEELIQMQLKRINVLHSIEKAVNSILDLDATLDHLVNEVTIQLGIDAATVLLLNPDTEMLEYVNSKGFRSSALKHTHLKLGESNAGFAANEQHIVSILDLVQEPDGFKRSELFADEGFISYFAVPLIAKGKVKGVLELFHRSPLDAEVEWMNFLETIADQAAIAIDKAALYDDLQHSRNELFLAYESTLRGWSSALDLKDKATEGHSQRVAEITIRIAQELGIKDEDLIHVRRGALLHDIGKMGIPDKILLKPGKLTDEEWIKMKQHPVYAHEMLSEIDYLKPALDIPYCHHEKWDGTGYPSRLKGKAIPLAARIFTVVDVWDALSSDRPYRPAWPKDKVFDYINMQAGSHFDPEVVEVFIKLVNRDEDFAMI